jgi:predicted TIM-barrel fold metal-dependent hydrolase
MADLEALRNRSSLATPRSSATLLPDPDRQELFCPIISVDDHYLEPLTMFDALPTRLRESAPRPIWDNEGVPYWLINGNKTPIVVTDGAVGRPISEWDLAPQKYEEFRTGVWEVSARVKDMDLNGVWASLNFPSTVWGFCGTQFARIPDRATGLACVRAYNDWVHEWCGSYPERFIASQLPWLADPVQAAHDIRVNAERGFKAVTFSENPESLGLPSLYSGEWDPFFAACQETGTVLNLHVGSSGAVLRPSSQSPAEVSTALFPVNGFIALIDWIYARVPLKFPDIRIMLSEGGVSWVPMAHERLRRVYRQREGSKVWLATDPDPIELVQRNFWFTSIEDPSAFRMLDLIGTDRVMVESDYPHKDSSWPETQGLLRDQLSTLPRNIVSKICFENAASLYRHPAPPESLLRESQLGRSASTSIAG